MNIKEVAEKTYRIQVQLPGVFNTFTVYFIQEDKGVVIDPGPTTVVPSIQEALDQLGIKELQYIIPTHIHVDHGGGTGNLAQLFPSARVILHPLGKEHLVNTSRLIKSTRKTYGDNFETLLGAIVSVPESQINTPDDGAIIPLNGRELQILYAPGHAPHHIAILDLKTKGLFCGEALGTPTKSAPLSPIPNAAPPSFDMDTYLDTIKKLQSMKPQSLFYAHDGVGKNPEVLISNAAENTKTFGDIILKALKNGVDFKAINHEMQNYIFTHLGVTSEEMDTRISVAGYTHYFKTIGLV